MFAAKSEVKPANVCREIWYAIGVASEIYAQLGALCVVTALTDGLHCPKSLHPLGKAVDLRVKNLAESEREPTYQAIKRGLEPLGFDVVWEGGIGATPATTGAHIHVEFDPKPGESFFKEVQ